MATKLEARVVRAAEAALAEQKYVTAIDVLVGVGWLTPQAVERWRQGRVEDLERLAEANLHKLSEAMRIFRRWATAQGLRPSETAYIARTRDRRPLRFSRSGEPTIEAAYRTPWVSRQSSQRPSASVWRSARARPPTWWSSTPSETGRAPPARGPATSS